MTNDVVTADVFNALAKRVEQLEEQMRHVHGIAEEHHLDPDDLFADNEMIAQAFRAFLEAEGITGEPIGAGELQKRMAQLDLEPNEFSRAVREMREE
ncbi:MAG TPA: hypothetical protein VFT66_25955 [Roseiflexaceae bacterium]|jgi:hypothetical protein|nr:hypothetical protein [Roseiflexaceae bacterium]